jgi:uncharacterized protein (DUF924 family)
MKTTQVEDVLQFWFPIQPDVDQATLVRQWNWWFSGGADADIIKHFSPLLEQAIAGELNNWSHEPRSRLALILIFDQFSRSIYRGTAQAFAQDPKACQLALEGIAIGHYAALKTPWEKTFFFLPLGHSEDLRNSELVVELADAIVQETPQAHRDLLTFSAEQAHRQRDIIARFGRHPHRNEILGRHSTPEELEYLAKGQLVHQRSFPAHLLQFLS